jgi:quinol-cytochrome oxidoreductase complex cytochrome b subunit/mono/diheme cytochrome c family protein
LRLGSFESFPTCRRGFAVFAKLSAWFDHRTGYKKLLAALLIEHIPGGAKWRYVWGSCLAFVFLIQLVTGVLLMTAYSPGDSSAWGSVYFIQYEMDFGWLIRGLHHFGSQTMVVLLGLHMLQVVIAGAHLPPREINWWLGLLLMGAVLALSLTGYLLPWDQKGFWATRVATNIAGNIPGIGSFLQKVIVGGPDYGNATLTRFYALHVGILPPLVILLTILHLAVFRRHGVTHPKNPEGEGWFWPDQAFRDLVVCLLLFGIMLGLVIYGDGHKIERPEGAPEPSFYDKLAHAGRDGRGANLDAPADPSSKQYPARPEWYFLFLFQLLKYFEGPQEILGTVVIPNGAFVLLAILPLLGYGWMRRFGHGFGILVVTSLLVGAGTLTCLAVAEDTVDPVAAGLITRIGTVLLPFTGVVLLFLLMLLALAGRGAFRKFLFGVGALVMAVLLAGSGGLLYAALSNRIPQPVVEFIEEQLAEAEKERALPALYTSTVGLMGSPLGQGPLLATSALIPGRTKEQRDKAKGFRQQLAEADEKAQRAVVLASHGIPETGPINLLRKDPLTRGKELFQQNCGSCHNHGEECHNQSATATDLKDFGTERWISDLLGVPNDRDSSGNTKRLRFMASWVEKRRAAAAKDNKTDELNAEFNTIARWLGDHPRRLPGKDEKGEYAVGYKAFESRCLECHRFMGEGGTTRAAPDFTGYGDAEWLRVMIMSPSHPSRYGKDNRMPNFRDLEGPAAAVTKLDVAQLRENYLSEIMENDPKKREEAEKRVEEATRLFHLSDIDRELIIRYVLKDYRVVFGGEPISGPKHPSPPTQ